MAEYIISQRYFIGFHIGKSFYNKDTDFFKE